MNLKIFNKLMTSRKFKAFKIATRNNRFNRNNKCSLIVISNQMINRDSTILLDNLSINNLNKEIIRIKETI